MEACCQVVLDWQEWMALALCPAPSHPCWPVRCGLPQDVQGSHDDDTSSREATPIAGGLALEAVDGSNSSSSFVKQSLASEDKTRGSEPTSLLAVEADDNKEGSKPASPVMVAQVGENNYGGSKSTSLRVVVGTVGESDKAEGKD
jgi:hypothetical protein